MHVSRESREDQEGFLENHWVWRLGERIQGTEEPVSKNAERGMLMVFMLRKACTQSITYNKEMKREAFSSP